MDSYVYAPKDDYKHRAYWRELYTVEEAEHLTGLINAAKAQGIVFYYALSPGLDITYSNQKEVTALKRKLEQVIYLIVEKWRSQYIFFAQFTKTSISNYKITGFAIWMY